MTKVWTKDPGDRLDFTIDWSTDLSPGDTVSDSTWHDISPGITTGVPASTHGPTSATIWIDGGTAGQVYSLSNTINTVGGREYTEVVELRITPAPAVLPDFNGCLWPLDPACLSGTWDTVDDATRARAASLASATLYRLTGYRVGGCPVKVRPRPQRGFCAVSVFDGRGLPFYPMNLNGSWHNAACPVCEDPRMVRLPGTVYSITEVKVDGVVVSPADYRIVDGHHIAWIGAGDPPWPGEQDYVIPDTQPGTFSVTYLDTAPVDGYGAYAAGLLAVEFAKACTKGTACRLPTNVISIVRQGVSYDMAAGAFPDGKTGIREIDGFIETWNPKGRRPGQVIIPGQQIAVTER